MATTLTPEQIKQYYATEGQKASPLSPLDWLTKQNQQTPTLETISAGVQDVAKQTQALTERVAAEGITPPPVQDLPSTPSTTDLSTTGGTPPTSGGSDESGALLAGLQAESDRMRKQLEDTYKKQAEDLQKQQETSQKRIDEFTTKQETALGSVDTLTQPFREDLEKTERERLYINKNFEDNQKLVGELEGLLTDIQAQVEREKGQTGLAAIRNPTIAKAKEDAAARVGVIQAVMNARNGQISVAENFIDRTSSAIAADRKDRLTYFNGLLDFYQGQKDDEGKKLITLTSDEKKYVEAQIGLLEGDMASAQKSVDIIKGMMTDPAKADILAQAGIKLTDTVEQINAKLSKEMYKREVADFDNTYAKDGYERVAFPEQDVRTKSGKYEVVRVRDSRGVEHTYLRAKKATTTKVTQPTNQDLKSNLDDKLTANNAFGSDGKISWETYLWLAQNWVNNEGKIADFDLNYPIDQYLDEGNKEEYRSRVAK
ncbi:MAG: hypothetical protein NUV80_00955 [Candidatus Berkelbacteria bacterium]|nr:hypothetical protein [Candidatus Berkelbacteria bacterium]